MIQARTASSHHLACCDRSLARSLVLLDTQAQMTKTRPESGERGGERVSRFGSAQAVDSLGNDVKSLGPVRDIYHPGLPSFVR